MGLFESIVKALEKVGVLRKDDLNLDPNGRLGINIDQDNVGLAKDTTIRGLYSKHVKDIPVSLSNSGSDEVLDTVISTPLSITETGEYGIVIALDTATTVKLDITIGTTTHSYWLNSGNALTANAWYEFAIHLAEKDQINFKIRVPASGSVNGIIRVFVR